MTRSALLVPLLIFVLALTITQYDSISFAESAEEGHQHEAKETVAGSTQDTADHQETGLSDEHLIKSAEAADATVKHPENEEPHHEHIHETGEGPHVHNSATAEAAQWVGVGTLVGAALVFGINGRRYFGGYRSLVMILAVGAGIMHLLLVPDHLVDVSTEHAKFFAAAGVAQVSFGILFMLRRTMKFTIIGIVGNIGSIILYWVTRIGNLPEPFGAPEGIDAVGIIAKIVEMSLVAILVYLAVHYKKVRFLEAAL